MHKYQKPIVVVILCLIFTTYFLYNTKSDLPLIFQKDLRAHDESSNSVVAANVTRKFFPPMVRVNPLNEKSGNWMEGPFWQHIPPLFAYVPYLFFQLDGQITIEVKRLSYAFITLLIGLLFIFCVYRFRKSLWATVAAAIAAIFWINTPFTHELITGYAFGVSDIVLALTVVGGFGVILWYLAGESEERLDYPFWKLILVGLVVALPIMTKNLLGAIPATTFFGLLIYDHKKISGQIWFAILSFLGLLVVSYGSLYLSSPQTFKQEIIVPIFHAASGYEGWGRPWHWYLTNYLPQRYLFGWTWVYYLGLILGLVISKQKTVNRHDKVLLWLSGGWFAWNLAAISLSAAKIPNFIYQSYLLSLFFIVYSVVLACHPERLAKDLLQDQIIRVRLRTTIITILFFFILVTGYEVIRFASQFQAQRAQAYDYQSEHEKFYGSAEIMSGLGVNEQDLVIIRVSDNDCWFRYYVLFLTGTESKTLLEMHFGYDLNKIKQKYNNIYFVINKSEQFAMTGVRIELADYSLIMFDPSDIEQALTQFLKQHELDIQQDIERMKKDKTSCQWLVPDEILNAP